MTPTDSAASIDLSVVMPAYQAERWIDFALSSIAAEADSGVEILLVDGGPTPAARRIAESYADRLRLRIFDRPDLGAWHGKANFGVSMAQARHVCLLCVDDVWLPGRAAAVRRWIERAPQAAMHWGPSAIIDQFGRKLGIWRCPFPAEVELAAQMVAERLLVQNSIAAPAPVFRKDAWLACGGLDEHLWYTADWDIWLKLATRGRVFYHGEITCGFRVHGGSLTAAGSSNVSDFSQQMRLVLERHLPSVGAAPGGAARVERAARASIAVNTALAQAAAGNPKLLFGALGGVLKLGPAGVRRFLRDSRIIDRLVPRVRARLRGAY